MSRFLRHPTILWAALAIAVLTAGVVLRAWHIATHPMWLDEAYSAYAAGKGWHFLWAVVPRYETHPPLYYSLLRAWTLVAGDGLLAHRLLGLVCGIATLPAAAVAARAAARLGGLTDGQAKWTALAAMALTAAAPILLMMTREVRPYPVMILVYTIAFLAVLLVAQRVKDGRGVGGGAYMLYLAATATMVWLHSLGPLFGFALGLAMLVMVVRPGLRRSDWAWLVGGHIAIGLLYLPALLIMLDQAPTWVKSTWLTFSTQDLWRRVTVVHAGPHDDMRAAATILLLAGLFVAWRSGRRLVTALVILAAVPVLISVIVSATIAPVFIIRTMTPLAIPALILMAIGATGLSGWARWSMLAPLLWLIGHQAWFDIQMASRGPSQDWYRALAWMQPRFRAGDIVLAYPNEGALPFDRAVRDLGLAMPSRAIPTEIPTLNPPPGSWYVSGSRGVPSLDLEHLHAIAIDPKTQAIPTIWLLRLGPWAYDKGDHFLHELSAGRTEIGSFRQGPIDIVGLRRVVISDQRKAGPGRTAPPQPLP